MSAWRSIWKFRAVPICVSVVLVSVAALPQLIDRTLAPNAANEGIALSLEQQVGAGRGSDSQQNSSLYLIARDPARAIRRGRQLFQRKFTGSQGVGPRTGDGAGDIATERIIGAGLSDSCAACHGRPRGSAGFGGDVVTRPDSRDAPHLFGLGLQEMLADEITSELRAIRDAAVLRAVASGRPVSEPLSGKGIAFGTITAQADGSVDTSAVDGIPVDLRVRPFFAHGDTISIREFAVGAFNAEMGLESHDPDLCAVTDPATPTTVVTPSGLVLDPTLDTFERPPVCSPSDDSDGDGVVNEIDPALIDFMEFYLLNYFKPALGRQTRTSRYGFRLMERVGCTGCHVRDLVIERDRRVADVDTRYDRRRGIFNQLFASVTPLFTARADGIDPAPLRPTGARFVVHNIFADFKRHDLGPAFHEIEYDGSIRTHFVTEPLWGVGSTAPYGHDGRSIGLREVILRHGGDASRSRRRFARLRSSGQQAILEALRSLVLFPPDDTASSLNPGERDHPLFPQYGHGSIDLSQLFTTPGPE